MAIVAAAHAYYIALWRQTRTGAGPNMTGRLQIRPTKRDRHRMIATQTYRVFIIVHVSDRRKINEIYILILFELCSKIDCVFSPCPLPYRV